LSLSILRWRAAGATVSTSAFCGGAAKPADRQGP